MGKKFYEVTPEDGRVRRRLPDGRRVLVAIPGQFIPWELAEELGLVKRAEPEPEPQPEPEKPARKPRKRATKKAQAAPKTVSYPTKKSKGK